MNLILVNTSVHNRYITFTQNDPQKQHIENVLKQTIGQTLFVGIPQGPEGKGKIIKHSTDELTLDVIWEKTSPKQLFPFHLIIGLPRPQTARKILEQASALGIESMTFIITEKSDINYGKSRLWHTNEWQECLQRGAEQACKTTFPSVYHSDDLSQGLKMYTNYKQKIALDIYEANQRYTSNILTPEPLCLAIGPERGWSNEERAQLTSSGFQLMHLGERILRCETACISAISIYLTHFNE